MRRNLLWLYNHCCRSRACLHFVIPPIPPQAQLYTQLLDSGFLSDTERDVLRWGRNATGERCSALLSHSQSVQCNAAVAPPE